MHKRRGVLAKLWEEGAGASRRPDFKTSNTSNMSMHCQKPAKRMKPKAWRFFGIDTSR